MIVEVKDVRNLTFEDIDNLIKFYSDIKTTGLKYSVKIIHCDMDPNLSWPDMEKVKIHTLKTAIEIIKRNIEENNLPIEIIVEII